jgi:hypothetical protein
MDPQQPDDKRRQPRIPVDLWMEVTSRGETYFQRATNLSRSGAWFAQTFPLPVGSAVTLKFELPDGSGEVACAGAIVTAQDLGMGVHFSELKDVDKRRIEALVSKAIG